jgi:mannose-binding lectin 1
VSGPERGGGNMQIWLVKDGSHDVGSSSIYTVGRWEGLALTIDGSNGYGGMVRGFLNDGTTDYKTVQNVEHLSFGHCSFNYRNLGRPSQIKLRYSSSGLKVEVDGSNCFESDRVTLPQGYQLGVSAASADNPDSFEIFKLVVLTDKHGTADSGSQDQKAYLAQQEQPVENAQHVVYGRSGQRVYKREPVPDDPYDNVIPDESADKFTTSKAQFVDLHNRIQSVNHHLSTIFRTISDLNVAGETRHAETSKMLGELKGLVSRLDKLEQLEQKVDNLEHQLKSFRNEMPERFRMSEHSVKHALNEGHEKIKDHVKEHAAPGHARLIFIIIAGQVLLVVGFIVYKKRKSTPKKYL